MPLPIGIPEALTALANLVKRIIDATDKPASERRKLDLRKAKKDLGEIEAKLTKLLIKSNRTD